MARNDNELKVILSGDSTGLVSELTKATGAVQDSANKMESSFTSLTSKLGSFQGVLATVGAVLAGGAVFKGAIEGAVEMGKETAKLSRVMGISSEQASVLRVAINSVYGDTDGYVSMVAKLTKALASSGDKFEKYGIQTKDSNGNLLDYQSIMENTSNRLMDFTEGVSRNEVMTQLFGKGWADAGKYLKITSGVMDEAREKADRLGLVFGPDRQVMVSKYRAEMRDFSEVVESAKLKVGDRLMPELIRVGAWFNKTGPDALGKIISVFDSVAKAFEYTTVKIVALGAAIGLAANAGLFGALTKVIAPMQNFVQMIRVQMALGAMQGVTGISSFGSALMTTLGPGGMIAIAIAGIAGLMLWFEKMSKAFEESQQEIREQLQKTVDATEKAKGYVEELTKAMANKDDKRSGALQARIGDINPELIPYLQKINDGYNTASDAYNAYLKTKQEGYANDRARTDQLLQQEAIQAERLEADIQELSKDIVEGSVEALRAKLQELSELHQVIAQHVLDSKNFADLATKGSEIEKQKGIGDGTGGAADNEKAMKALERAVERKKEIRAQEARDAGEVWITTDALEADFLRKEINRHGLNADQKREITNRINKLMESDTQKRFLNEKEAELAKYESDIKAAEHNFDKQIELAKAREAFIAKTYIGDKKRLEDAHKQTIELERKKEEEILKLKMDALQKEQALEQANFKLKLDKLDQLRDKRELTETEYLQKKLELALQELNLEEKILNAKLILVENDPSKKIETQQLEEQIELLQKKYELISQQGNYAIEKEQTNENPYENMKAGLQDWVDYNRTAAKEVRTIFSSVGKAITDSLSNAFQSMLTRGMSFNQKMKQLWDGLKQTVIKAISDMLAKELAAWAMKKVMSAWNTTDTVKSETEAGTKTASNTVEATSGIFKAHSGIPFVGVAIAMGLIALMMAAMSSAKSSATGRATGGLAGLNGPELTLLGEHGITEVVAPEHDFKDWAAKFAVRGADIAASSQASKMTSAMQTQMAAQTLSSNPASASVQNTFHIGSIDPAGAAQAVKDALTYHDKHLR
jgi:hypothetical protein